MARCSSLLQQKETLAYVTCSVCNIVNYCHQYTRACDTTLLPRLYILWRRRERNLGYALLMTANEPETALYRAPTFSLLLVSHGGISYVCVCNHCLTTASRSLHEPLIFIRVVACGTQYHRVMHCVVCGAITVEPICS